MVFLCLSGAKRASEGFWLEEIELTHKLEICGLKLRCQGFSNCSEGIFALKREHVLKNV
jgi:hypothetical protein